jgi:hypothetical protein
MCISRYAACVSRGTVRAFVSRGLPSTARHTPGRRVPGDSGYPYTGHPVVYGPPGTRLTCPAVEPRYPWFKRYPWRGSLNHAGLGGLHAACLGGRVSERVWSPLRVTRFMHAASAGSETRGRRWRP